MSDTRRVKETRVLLTIKGHYRKFVTKVNKLRHSASDDCHGVESESDGGGGGGGEGGEDIIAEPFSLDDLPEGCISIIVSFTTPQDACVFSSVSKTFESAIKSDIVWEKFIPPEYESLVPQSEDYSSKKDLYFALCDKPILIDNGEKSFWIEKSSGKRCFMLSSMNLSITWGDSPVSWQWISVPESRFETVAELLEVCLFEIRGRVNSRVLSPRTRYSVYIVFKKVNPCYGFKDVAIEVVVGVVGKDLDEPYRRYVCFDEAMEDEQFLRRDRRRRKLVKPKKRNDGWMELKLGEFFNHGGLLSNDEIEMVALEAEQRHWKRGLIIQGIEIRPVKLQ